MSETLIEHSCGLRVDKYAGRVRPDGGNRSHYAIAALGDDNLWQVVSLSTEQWYALCERIQAIGAL